MPLAVTCQKRHLAALKRSNNEDLAGVAEWGRDSLFRDVSQTIHVVKPAAADNANVCLRQTCLLNLTIPKMALMHPSQYIVDRFSVLSLIVT
jgi:alpha-tubulin suppressor-like RCC1 family protein